MQTVTFSCPHCSNLMAVGVDHLGQEVRCPTCQNVVVAPAEAPAPIALEMPHELTFDASPQESHESIFGEVHDEDLFGSRPLKIDLPEGPPSAGPAATQFASYPPSPHLAPPPADMMTSPALPAMPLDETAPPAEPWYASAAPPPAPAEEPWYASATPAGAAPEPPPPAAESFVPPPEPVIPPTESPWVNENTPAEVPAEAGWLGDASAAGEHAEPIRFRPPQETLERRKGSNLMLSILAPYAVVMTLVAIWYFWKYQNFEAQHHPLEMMGDVGRVDLPRKKDGSQTFKMPLPEEPLPARLKVKLGDSVTVGDLEVTPVRIEQGRIKDYTVLKGDQIQSHISEKDGLMLYLRLRNLSSQWIFCPTDPVFERRYDPEWHDKKERPFTLIEVGQQFFFGGPLDQSRFDARTKRRYAEGQENDEKPLNPGEERLTVVYSDPRNEAVLPAVAQAAEPATWRVHLRRGVTHYRGYDYSVTAVVGVEFTARDVKKVARN